jgi:biopolymer transport protein TolR
MDKIDKKSRTHLKSEINMTPLVDVMLVLLVIFMVSAPMMTTGIPIQLPKAVTQNLPADGDPLSLSINEHGEIFLQGSLVPRKDLGPKIASIVKENPDVRLQLRADQSLPYAKVMEVMAEIARSGCHKVALVTDPLVGGHDSSFEKERGDQHSSQELSQRFLQAQLEDPSVRTRSFKAVGFFN